MEQFCYDGHTLTWEEHSRGDETLVFLHGWSVGRPSWLPVLEHFTDIGRCVTLDLPGHYPAHVPPDYAALSQDTLIALEARAIEQMGGGRPVTLIGHSAGGLTALGVASHAPHLVRRIVAINSVVWGHFTGIVRSALWLRRHRLDPTLETLWNFTLREPWTLMNALSFFVYEQPAFWKNPLAWQLCRDVHRWYHLHSLHNLAVFLDMLGTCDIRPLLHATMPQIPVLVVVGERDPVLPPRQSFWLAANLPHAEMRLFEHTGHIPHIEAPRAFEQTVKAWLMAAPAAA